MLRHSSPRSLLLVDEFGKGTDPNGTECFVVKNIYPSHDSYAQMACACVLRLSTSCCNEASPAHGPC
jgi:hypothetical protein